MEYFRRPWWWYATVLTLLIASWGASRVLADVFPAGGTGQDIPRFAALTLLTLTTFLLGALLTDAPKQLGKTWWVATLIACGVRLLLDVWLGI
ncbi:hypothetical protein GO986_17250 [Deinococcus sp. HMF7620]|uniref:Uncharacterized protein n=1 Tax=Deinococcus arboris TaxID=2682977 RepID=A0A7C9I4W3_9DEIO|nr:hypothetical protein [Deinococcus arboris]MVN88491.1 hypothetical protein [Deinococcus arboris]